MKGMRKILLKAMSTAMSVAVLSGSMFSVAASAAAPVIIVKTGAESANSGDSVSTKTVSNLRVINLEQPRVGNALDTKATIMTDQEVFWEVPVVWIDEKGAIAKAFTPGIELTPVITFFVPNGITIAQDSANGGFAIKLPEFLDGKFDSSNLLIVEDPSNNITFITTTGISDTLSAMNGVTPYLQNAISSGNSLEQINKQKINGAYDYASYMASNGSWAEPSTGDSSESASSSDENDSSSDDGPEEMDPVLMYCSKSAIDNLGYDNMAMLYNLVSDVILPQVVSELTKAFPAFTESDDGKAIGEKIGLLVYTSEFPDSQASSQTSIAYVSGVPDGTGAYYYMMGVNAKTLFTKDPETGTYKYNEDERTNLENTVIHEMLHAFMDDYTRAGVVRMPDQSNDYPGWFCEGIASAVENVYTFRYDQYSKIYNKNLKTSNKKVLEFYNNYSEIYPAGTQINHVPDIGTSDDEGNRISAYTMGYMATVYLSFLSQASENGTDQSNYKSFKSEDLRSGLNSILSRLHEGETLDEVIKDISGGKYENTDDFTAKFVKGENGDGTNGDGGKENLEDSLAFCTAYLNYMGKVTKKLQKTDPNATANGSILLPLDTAAKSPIKKQASKDAKENQKYFNIYHDPTVEESEQPYVKSTVDPKIIFTSGGKKQKIKADKGGKGKAVAKEKADNAQPTSASVKGAETASDEETTAAEESALATAEEPTQAVETTPVVRSAPAPDVECAPEEEPAPVLDVELIVVEETVTPTEESAPAVEAAEAAEPEASEESAPSEETAQAEETISPAEESVPAVESATTEEPAPAEDIAPAEESAPTVESTGTEEPAASEESAPSEEALAPSDETGTTVEATATEESLPSEESTPSDETAPTVASAETEASPAVESASAVESDSFVEEPASDDDSEDASDDTEDTDDDTEEDTDDDSNDE